MKDAQMLAAFEKSEGGPTKAAHAIGITPQMWVNWKTRALPRYGHLLIWLASNQRGRALLKRWQAEQESRPDAHIVVMPRWRRKAAT